MGVEVDQYDKPVAYHLYKDHPYNRNYLSQNQHIRVPAEEKSFMLICHKGQSTEEFL